MVCLGWWCGEWEDLRHISGRGVGLSLIECSSLSLRSKRWMHYRDATALGLFGLYCFVYCGSAFIDD